MHILPSESCKFLPSILRQPSLSHRAAVLLHTPSILHSLPPFLPTTPPAAFFLNPATPVILKQFCTHLIRHHKPSSDLTSVFLHLFPSFLAVKLSYSLYFLYSSRYTLLRVVLVYMIHFRTCNINFLLHILTCNVFVFVCIFVYLCCIIIFLMHGLQFPYLFPFLYIENLLNGNI